VAYVELGNPGLPHAVTEIPGLNWDMKEALWERGNALRHHPQFPKGANVNFFTWLDDAKVRILTFERGVEDYTLACGTGSGSVAVALWTAGKLPGGCLTVKNRGGDLTVTILGQNGSVEELYLEGPTEVVKIMDV
jgi:diaminopimelate epimerase